MNGKEKNLWNSNGMKKKTIVFDEDCEELSSVMMKSFKSAVAHRICRKMLKINYNCLFQIFFGKV